jgi:hypothetical protein
MANTSSPNYGVADPSQSHETKEELTELVEDPTPLILDKITYGYVAIHVYSVEPRWNRYNQTADANRSLDIKHAKRLADNMKVSLKIADAPNRLCITMSQKQIDACLTYIAMRNLYRTIERISWYRKHEDNDEVKQEMAEERESIDQAI